MRHSWRRFGSPPLGRDRTPVAPSKRGQVRVLASAVNRSRGLFLIATGLTHGTMYGNRKYDASPQC